MIYKEISGFFWEYYHFLSDFKLNGCGNTGEIQLVISRQDFVQEPLQSIFGDSMQNTRLLSENPVSVAVSAGNDKSRKSMI